MNDKEKIKEWIGNHDDYCEVCIHDKYCPHGCVCYGGEPIEPPCCMYELEDILNEELILEKIKEKNE